MMCANTVQVAARPGEVVSNTGKKKIKAMKAAPDPERIKTPDLQERPSFSFDSRNTGIDYIASSSISAINLLSGK